MNSCVFCRIVAGELPTQKGWEDEEIVAFKDVNPSAPVHVLVVPKRHIDKLTEATSQDRDLLGGLQLAAAVVAQKMGIADGFRLMLNNGASAGQVVWHLHYHVQGGWKGGVK